MSERKRRPRTEPASKIKMIYDEVEAMTAVGLARVKVTPEQMSELRNPQGPISMGMKVGPVTFTSAHDGAWPNAVEIRKVQGPFLKGKAVLSNELTDSPSMGCRVSFEKCEICGKNPVPCKHVHDVKPDPRFENVVFSFVSNSEPGCEIKR